MKKLLLGISGLALVAAAALTTISTINANSTLELSDLMTKNLEALTRMEPSEPYCYNGGPGATTCSIDGGINIAGYGVSAACSVGCGDGYYACCTLRCTCVES
jgi:hypothetical protein